MRFPTWEKKNIRCCNKILIDWKWKHDHLGDFYILCHVENYGSPDYLFFFIMDRRLCYEVDHAKSKGQS